ncbi:MAG: hypothetical protein CL866_02630 [Cycloclasticus sp.]|nr:hypothetical protein [Cycloclasticus sp.]MBG95753.1 hypothetical protein [Cycloclasticus sp.]HAI96904.1 hypothetical protein [Methylococcaceae bacterium]|tara:strand:+ start:1404 stop:2699 length:1296 start_codon:yes stop_codon:yes gene_type:complete
MNFKTIITLLLYLFLNTVFAAQQDLSAKQLQAATTINQLGADLLHAKFKHGEVNNAMVSSVSLYYALSVLQQGAAEHSSDLLNSVLLSGSGLNLNDIAPALAEKIVADKRDDYPAIAHFQLANSIWSTNGVTTDKPFFFAEQFKSNATGFYDAMPYPVDFEAEGAGLINDWASEKTNGLIPKIIDQGTLKQFLWVIMNAAYFEGAWGTPMRAIPENSSFEFTTLNGKNIKPKSISTYDYKASVLENEDGSVAFKLPFLGNKYSFIVHFPAESEIDLQQWLLEKGSVDMPSIIDDVLDNKSEWFQLTIQMPSFSFSDGIEMKKGSPIADALGLAPLFLNQVNLSLLVDKQKTPLENQATTVGLIKQQSKIELDEKGVKAAAVTLIGGIKVTSVERPLPSRTILLDRPFAFSIIENSSRTMLFNGVLTNPSVM